MRIGNGKLLDNTYSGTGDATSRAFGSWFLGARYYFNDKFAVFSELGYGAASFNLGLALKF